MGRFSNLEFEGEIRKPKPASLSQHYLDQEKNERFYLSQADQLFREGRFEKALRAYSRALEINPDLFEAWFGQVRMLIELEEFHEADIWGTKALERYPDQPELIATRAVANARMANYQQALAFSDASLKSGNSPYLWLARGDVLLAGRQQNHDYCFGKALIENRRDDTWFWHLCIGRVYRYYRKFAHALKACQKALSLEVGSAFLWYEQGICQQALGFNQPALQSFSQALALDPSYTQAGERLTAISQAGLLDKLFGFFRRF